jgi:hypothetical protein
MFAMVKGSLGPVFWPMLALWIVTVYLGLDIIWRLTWGGDQQGLESEAAKLKRLGNAAMVVGLFGQVWSVATSLSGLHGGASAINDLIRLLGVSLWSTLAGISVALLAEAFLFGMLWLVRAEGQVA